MEAYVYGVIRASAGWRSPGEGVEERPVELVSHGELAALVSDAPTVPVEASRHNLMAHSSVLQAVIAERCVLPMRFGVVMPSRAAVEEELLTADGDRLATELRALEPYVELDVRALCPEEALLRMVVTQRADVAELREAIRGRPAVATHYDRIRLGELVASAVAQKREEVTAGIAVRLAPLAAATERGEPLHEQMLASVAFLVARTRIAKFDAGVEELGRELGPDIRLRLIGPLPPHNFVDLEAGTEAEAWA